MDQSHPSQEFVASPEALLQMVFGYQLSQAVYVAAKLGIADLLSAGPQSGEDLGRATGVHGPSLDRVMRVLCSAGVFTKDQAGRFIMAPLARYLLAGGSHSVRDYALMHGSPWFWRGWDLPYSVTTGKAGFAHAHGQEFFQYLAQHPEASALFDRAMTGAAPQRHADVAAAYDFSQVRTVVDVGGGNGGLLAAILKANPRLKSILYDQPHVVAGADLILSEVGVADRCRIVAGDFFASVPEGGDTYILAAVIHDWDDDRASVILKNCARAIGRRGTLLLVERVLPAATTGDTLKFLSDLNMLVLLGGRERTEEEFRALLVGAGFSLKRIILTPRLFSIIEAVPAS